MASGSALSSSSLAYNRELVLCPNKAGWVLVSESTGAVVPAACHRNWCPVCGPKKAFATAIAVDMSAPIRFMRLSLVGDDHQTRRRRIKKLIWLLRSAGYSIEYWGVVEQNPRATGYHAHVWQRGDYIPQSVLQEACVRAGMGYPDIRAWKPIKGRQGAAYGVKAIGRAGSLYGVKGTREGGLESFLEANGGRYGMWSRGFFGAPYRDALREGLTQVFGSEDRDAGPWRLRGTV